MSLRPGCSRDNGASSSGGLPDPQKTPGNTAGTFVSERGLIYSKILSPGPLVKYVVKKRK